MRYSSTTAFLAVLRMRASHVPFHVPQSPRSPGKSALPWIQRSSTTVQVDLFPYKLLHLPPCDLPNNVEIYRRERLIQLPFSSVSNRINFWSGQPIYDGIVPQRFTAQLPQLCGKLLHEHGFPLFLSYFFHVQISRPPQAASHAEALDLTSLHFTGV